MRKAGPLSKKHAQEQCQTDLGRRLRALRKARKLTLDQLSQMAGVSKAMLSQIEQHRVNPTVAVMLRVVHALQVGLAELVDAPAQSNIFRIIAAKDKQYAFPADRSCSIQTLSPLGLEKDIEFYRVAFDKGGSLRSEPHFPGTEEFLHVAKGRLTVTVDKETADVGKGDSIHYRADVSHCLRNIGKGEAQMYVVVRYRSE